MMQRVGFVNGLPLKDQVPIRARIVLLFIEAIQAYQPSAANRPNNSDPPGAVRWPTAEPPSS